MKAARVCSRGIFELFGRRTALTHWHSNTPARRGGLPAKRRKPLNSSRGCSSFGAKRFAIVPYALPGEASKNVGVIASEVLIESGKFPEFTGGRINGNQPAQNDDHAPQTAYDDIREATHGSPHPTFLVISRFFISGRR